MSTDRTPRRPGPAAPDPRPTAGTDEDALRALLARQRDLFPLLRRDALDSRLYAEYLTVCGLIFAIADRIGARRYAAIVEEVSDARR